MDRFESLTVVQKIQSLHKVSMSLSASLRDVCNQNTQLLVKIPIINSITKTTEAEWWLQQAKFQLDWDARHADNS